MGSLKSSCFVLRSCVVDGFWRPRHLKKMRQEFSSLHLVQASLEASAVVLLVVEERSERVQRWGFCILLRLVRRM